MRDGKIVKFASGFNEQTFFKFIRDGMFALDREEESMRKTGSKPAAIETRGATTKGYLNDTDCEWDPWEGVRAPDEWIFTGYLTFVILGPTTDCHEVLMKMGGSINDNKSNKNSSGRVHMRKGMKKMVEAERVCGGADRGMSLHTKVNLTAIAQGEDDADMRDQDKEMATLVTRLNSVQGMMSTFSSLASTSRDPTQLEKYMAKVFEYEAQVVQLNQALTEMASRKRKRNPIVEEVLAHGARSLGIAATSKAPRDGAPTADTLQETENGTKSVEAATEQK